MQKEKRNNSRSWDIFSITLIIKVEKKSDIKKEKKDIKDYKENTKKKFAYVFCLTQISLRAKVHQRFLIKDNEHFWVCCDEVNYFERWFFHWQPKFLHKSNSSCCVFSVAGQNYFCSFTKGCKIYIQKYDSVY